MRRLMTQSGQLRLSVILQFLHSVFIVALYSANNRQTDITIKNKVRELVLESVMGFGNRYQRVGKRFPSSTEAEGKSEQSYFEKQTSNRKPTKATQKTTIEKRQRDAIKRRQESSVEKPKGDAIEVAQETATETLQENISETKNGVEEVKALEQKTVETAPLTNGAEPVAEEVL